MSWLLASITHDFFVLAPFLLEMSLVIVVRSPLFAEVAISSMLLLSLSLGVDCLFAAVVFLLLATLIFAPFSSTRLLKNSIFLRVG